MYNIPLQTDAPGKPNRQQRKSREGEGNDGPKGETMLEQKL